jgi:hypothetical protein
VGNSGWLLRKIGESTYHRREEEKKERLQEVEVTGWVATQTRFAIGKKKRIVAI